jgi:hypothetical protein
MGMTAAIVLFVVALLAELIAVGLIVAESRKGARQNNLGFAA